MDLLFNRPTKIFFKRDRTPLSLNQRFDYLTEERIKSLVVELEQRKEAMHSSPC